MAPKDDNNEGSDGSDLGEDERGIDEKLSQKLVGSLSKREITASSFTNDQFNSPPVDHEGLIKLEGTIIVPDSLEEEPDVPSELNSHVEENNDEANDHLMALSCCSDNSHLNRQPG